MKCLAFVDLHGSTKAYEKVKIKAKKSDFIVCAGDFTVFETDIKKWMKKFSELEGKVFLVHGNHEDERICKQLAKNYSTIEFVHGKIIEYHSLVIVGWGGGGFSQKDFEFELWVKDHSKELKKHAGKKILFITHAPFYKTALDLIGDQHAGNKSFRKFILDYNVDLAICGHFHENAGKQDTIKKCTVYNPGPHGKIIHVWPF